MGLATKRSPLLSRRLILRMVPAFTGTVLVSALGRATAAPSADQLRFIAIADSGGGNADQKAVADRMAEVHRRQPVDLVVMAGDNIYPNGDINQAKEKFSIPYKSLLDAGVPFHAVLGNHDIRTANGNPQIAYPPFGMKGRWYTLRRGPVEFFMIDTNGNADWGRQLPWLRESLAASTSPWKVVVGHHPIYSSGFYGNDEVARKRLAPMFRTARVQMYINGHDHNYERSKPINGTTYLVVGGGGAYLRPVDPGPNSARAISVHSFAELTAGTDSLVIQAWDSSGRSIDRAVLDLSGQVVG